MASRSTRPMRAPVARTRPRPYPRGPPPYGPRAQVRGIREFRPRLSSQAAYSKGPLLDLEAIRNTRWRRSRNTHPPGRPSSKTANFSGGNQQKIVVAREIERDPTALIIGQPTRGVDIGAIEFIHRRIIEMRDAGKAILLVSVELDEIRALLNRILVMFAGHVVGEKTPDAGEQTLGLMMAGIARRGLNEHCFRSSSKLDHLRPYPASEPGRCLFNFRLRRLADR